LIAILGDFQRLQDPQARQVFTRPHQNFSEHKEDIPPWINFTLKALRGRFLLTIIAAVLLLGSAHGFKPGPAHH
jgi:hypothetical protein